MCISPKNLILLVLNTWKENVFLFLSLNTKSKFFPLPVGLDYIIYSLQIVMNKETVTNISPLRLYRSPDPPQHTRLPLFWNIGISCRVVNQQNQWRPALTFNIPTWWELGIIMWVYFLFVELDFWEKSDLETSFFLQSPKKADPMDHWYI